MKKSIGRSFFQKLRKVLSIKRVLLFGGIMSLLAFVFAWWAHKHIADRAQGRVYDHIGTIPSCDVALVLGTSRYVKNGHQNLFFKYRIEAISKLYHAGKVKRILVSGDNGIEQYDEPSDMRDALIELGVPSGCITLDYAGFRTLDSVVRMKEVFGQSKGMVISQQFHVERALYIGDCHGMSLVGFCAQSPGVKYSKTIGIREYLARAKALLDLHVLDKQPRFLGEKEIVNSCS